MLPRYSAVLFPAVTPKLSELPADPGRRDAVLDSSHVTSGPEQGSPDPGKQLVQPTDAGCSCNPTTELNYLLHFRAEPILNALELI